MSRSSDTLAPRAAADAALDARLLRRHARFLRTLARATAAAPGA